MREADKIGREVSWEMIKYFVRASGPAVGRGKEDELNIRLPFPLTFYRLRGGLYTGPFCFSLGRFQETCGSLVWSVL